ncbi:hypothetical protein MY4038_003043 [Beauveria bassiana]
MPKTDELEQVQIGQAPPYLAISHAWSDCIFSKHGNFGQSFGSDAIRQTIQQRGLDQVGYCWIDLFCIIQDSEDDMCEQMPLMSHIYGDAKVVLIILTNKLNLTQEQVDHGSAELDEALAIWDAEAWTAAFDSVWQPSSSLMAATAAKQRCNKATEGGVALLAVDRGKLARPS